MKRFITSLLITVFLALSLSVAAADETPVQSRQQLYEAKKWSLSLQGGAALAFGDDSYDIFKDFNNAWGPTVSVAVGYRFNRLLGARLKVRYLHPYSRINLESYEVNLAGFPDVLRRRGFYGYNCMETHIEGNLDISALLRRGHTQASLFHFYLNAGVGFNVVGGYDARVDKWSEKAGVFNTGFYEVDTRTHTMPTGLIGGTIDLRLSPSFSINIEAMCTFTGDLLEGVKYEEGYDAYVTGSVGFTTYF